MMTYLILLIVVVVVLLLIYFTFCKRKKYPHNIFLHYLVDPPRSVENENKKVKPLTEEEIEKVMNQSIYSHPGYLKEDYDVIVIGSGISAMATAGLLSRVGKKCLLLEGHDRFGGMCHSFEEEGFEFSSGVHYLNDAKKPGFKWPLAICSDSQLEYGCLEDHIKELFSFGKKDVEFVGYYDIDKTHKLFVETFPHEEESLRKFFEIAKKCKKCYENFIAARSVSFPLNILLKVLGYESRFHKYGKFSANEMMDKCGIKDPSLRSMINYIQMYFSTHDSDEFIFPLCAVILDIGWLKWSVKGGGGMFPRLIIPSLKSNSKALHHAKIKKILLKTNKVSKRTGEELKGVELESGDRAFAPIIISSAGILNTMNMFPRNVRERSSETAALRKVLKNCEYTGFFFLIHVGLDESVESWEDVEMFHQVTRFYAQEDTTKNYRTLRDHCKPPDFEVYEECFDFVIMLDSCNTSRKMMIMMAPCFPHWFEEFEDTQTGKRGNEYEEWKDNYCNKIMDQLYIKYPLLEGKIEYFDAATNLTTRDYVFSPKGSIYGLNQSYEKLCLVTGNKKVFNPMKGIYLVGQDITGDGLYPAVLSSFYAIGDILGRNLFLDLLSAEKVEKKLKKK